MGHVGLREGRMRVEDAAFDREEAVRESGLREREREPTLAIYFLNTNPRTMKCMHSKMMAENSKLSAWCSCCFA